MLLQIQIYTEVALALLPKMKQRFQVSVQDKVTMGRRSFDRENHSGGIVSGGKRNQCVILPANVPMVADSFERRNQNW